MRGWVFGWPLLGVAVCVVLAIGSAWTLQAAGSGWPFINELQPQHRDVEKPAVLAQAAPLSESTTTTTTSFGGWVVTCRSAGAQTPAACSTEFRVVNKDNQALVLIWMMGRNAQGQLISEFVTPADVLIKPGVTVVLDGKPPSVADFAYCTSTQGCRAMMDLPPKLVRDLKAATRAKIGFTLPDGRVTEIAVDIPGISQALDMLGA